MNKTEKFWDKQSGKFEKQVSRDEQSFNKIIEKAKKYLKDTDRVLDFACGIGTSSLQMINYVKEIQAIDISSGMIDVAKKRLANLSIKNIDFMHNTLFDEQFVNESFDVITAFNILHLLEDPGIVIQRIHDLLKPGGLFISQSAFLGEKSSFRFVFYLIAKTGLVPNLRLLKISELEKVIASENLKVIETRPSYKPTPSGFIVAKKM